MISYRTLSEHDWDDWVVSNARGFLTDIEVAAEEGEQIRDEFEFDRSLGAFDGDELVGKTHAISFAMSVPGGEASSASSRAASSMTSAGEANPSPPSRPPKASSTAASATAWRRKPTA